MSKHVPINETVLRQHNFMTYDHRSQRCTTCQTVLKQNG